MLFKQLDAKTIWVWLNLKKKSARITENYIVWSSNYGAICYVQKFNDPVAAGAFYRNISKLNFDKLFSDVKSELNQDF